MIDSYHLLMAFSMLGTGLSYLWHVIVPQQPCEKDAIDSHFIDEEDEPKRLRDSSLVVCLKRENASYAWLSGMSDAWLFPLCYLWCSEGEGEAAEKSGCSTPNSAYLCRSKRKEIYLHLEAFDFFFSLKNYLRWPFDGSLSW